MSIRIPEVNTNKFFSKQNFSTRNIVKQAASDGFLPVIALEAFVEAGRTSGAVFWLGGVSSLNWLFEKLGQKILKLPEKSVDIASDSVRNPLKNFLAIEKTKDGAAILEKTMARFKFVKVISSVLIANAFIGFVLPFSVIIIKSPISLIPTHFSYFFRNRIIIKMHVFSLW